MRRIIWPAATLILMSMAFGAGKFTGRFRSLPAIVATLPGDEAEFSRELDNRIRERFPVGTSEDKLIDYLKNEQFRPGMAATRRRQFERIRRGRAHLREDCARALARRRGRRAHGSGRRLREPLSVMALNTGLR